MLESFLPGDRRRALAGGGHLPARPRGAALFADISGFTPLTEALATDLGPQRGAEELTHNLNRVYDAIIDDLATHGGEVLYFSGDAITCWLDGDDGSNAVSCGLAMQETISLVGAVDTGAGTIQLSIKVAVAVGEASRFVVGDPDICQVDVLAGGLVDRLASAEQLADEGDVMAEQSALEALGPRLDTSELRIDPESGRISAVVDSLTSAMRAPDDCGPLPTLPDEVVRSWMLEGVYNRLTGGAGEFLAELRTAYPIFVRFGGFDFDDDPDAATALDRFVRSVQRVLTRYGGHLLGLTVGDKGAYLFAVLGTPESHEDDAHRAAAAASEISALEATTGATGLQIGIAAGRVYSGTYGHRDRRTFTCLGDAVNLAARLMGAAPAGSVYGSDIVADGSRDWLAWAPLPPLELKGKSDPVPAARLLGHRRREIRRHRRYPLPIVGRDGELDRVREALLRTGSGERAVVGVAAEAGMGKSRFVAEVLRELVPDGMTVAYGEAEALQRTTSYVVWRSVWRALFDLDDDATDDIVRDRVERTLQTIDPALARRAPLLGNLLSVNIPDNDLTRLFDAKLRKASLENLLASVLAARAATRPLLIVLEDCHWIDAPSVDLAERLVAAATELPVMFLLAFRPGDQFETVDGLRRLPGFQEVILEELDPSVLTDVIRAKTTQVFGADTMPSTEMLELVLDRAQGNPFYAEELVNYMRRLDLDPGDPASVLDLDLPDSLSAIVLSRVDTLDERPRETLKVASVVGRDFEASMLPLVYPALGSEADVGDHLDHLSAADLVVPYDVDRASWLFRHAITREVAYESIPYALRTPLHEAVGNAIETIDPEAVEFKLDLLAHHFWHSDNLSKKLMYLARAGDAARSAYANESAIGHFERLAELQTGSDRSKTLLELAQVLELVGDWERSEREATTARDLAESAGDDGQVGWATASLAEVARKQGRYDDAVELLDGARRAFRRADDEAGEGQVLHLLGTVAAQRGKLDEARVHYESSRAVRERLGDEAGLAGLLSNLGVVAEYRGDYERSRSFHRRALDLRKKLGDRWAIAVSCTNLGMIAVLEQRFDEARDLFEEAMRLNVEVGDAWMVAVTHNNLGNANRGLGATAAACRHYAASAEAYRAYDDKWALAFLFEDIAGLAAENDPEVAIELLGVADTLREELASPRPETLEEELTSRMGGHLDRLDVPTRHRARMRGRSRALGEAVDLAIDACRRVPV